MLFRSGLKEAGLKSVTLTLVTSDTTTDKNVGEFVQSQVQGKLSNVKVEVKSLPSKSSMNLVTTGKYDLYLSLWLNDYADPISELETLQSDNSHNYGKYESTAFNQQLNLARSKNATTTKAYFANLLAAQEQMNKDYPVLPLYTMVEDHLVKSNLKGVLWHKVGMVDYTRAYFK